jgi:hypothetical protein
MRYVIQSFIAINLALATGGAFAAHESQEHGAGSSMAETTAAPRNRLRFRNGPVCMCTLGMSEEDIQRAQSERRRSGN